MGGFFLLTINRNESNIQDEEMNLNSLFDLSEFERGDKFELPSEGSGFKRQLCLLAEL